MRPKLVLTILGLDRHPAEDSRVEGHARASAARVLKAPEPGARSVAVSIVLLVPLFAWLLLADNAQAESLMQLEAATSYSGALMNVAAPPAYTLQAELIAEPTARVVTVGRVATFSLAFKNTGSVPWVRGTAAEARLGVTADDRTYGDGGFAIRWLGPDRPANQSERLVRPGAIGHFTFRIRGAALGDYHIPVGLLVEGVSWMGPEAATVDLIVR